MGIKSLIRYVKTYIDAHIAVDCCSHIANLCGICPAVPKHLAHSLNGATQTISFTSFPPLPNPDPVYLPTTPPPLPTPISDQTFPANLIPTLQQRRYIHVERTIHLGIRKQLVYSLERRCERVCRRPRRFQEVEADLAGLEIHVWVADGGCEGDFGRGVGVGGRDEDVEVPETGWRAVSGGAGDHLVMVGDGRGIPS